MKRFFLFLALGVVITSCKKKETDPSIYNFKVIDIYSGLPVPNAKAILCNTFYPAAYKYTTLGYTNSNGEFQYICDKESDHTSGNYSYYNVYFINQNNPYTSMNSTTNHIEVTQTHKTNNYTIKLLQSSTLCLKTKRVSVQGLNSNSCGFQVRLNSYASNYFPYNAVYLHDTLNQVHDTCVCVMSNKVTVIDSYINFNCNNSATNLSYSVNIGYNDTTYFNIDY